MSQVRQSKSDNSLRKEDHEDGDLAQERLIQSLEIVDIQVVKESL